jgi:hypothetical protein
VTERKLEPPTIVTYSKDRLEDLASMLRIAGRLIGTTRKGLEGESWWYVYDGKVWHVPDNNGQLSVQVYDYFDFCDRLRRERDNDDDLLPPFRPAPDFHLGH